MNTMWDNITQSNVCIIGLAEGNKSENGEEIFEEILTKHFSKFKTSIHRSKKLRESQAWWIQRNQTSYHHSQMIENWRQK